MAATSKFPSTTAHVEDKIGQLDRFDGKLKILRVDVELFHEKNPRQTSHCQRVEITLRGKGPVVRAEAAEPDFYAGLDPAVRQARQPAAPGGRPPPGAPRPAHPGQRPHGRQRRAGAERAQRRSTATGSSPRAARHRPGRAPAGRIVREKHHPATPMTVDQALHEMELVGHDFFLFQCADTGQPTVVYRRHAFDYGLIRLTRCPQNGTAAHGHPRRPSRGRPRLTWASGRVSAAGPPPRLRPAARTARRRPAAVAVVQAAADDALLRKPARRPRPARPCCRRREQVRPRRARPSPQSASHARLRPRPRPPRPRRDPVADLGSEPAPGQQVQPAHADQVAAGLDGGGRVRSSVRPRARPR